MWAEDSVAPTSTISIAHPMICSMVFSQPSNPVARARRGLLVRTGGKKNESVGVSAFDPLALHQRVATLLIDRSVTVNQTDHGDGHLFTEIAPITALQAKNCHSNMLGFIWSAYSAVAPVIVNRHSSD